MHLNPRFLARKIRGLAARLAASRDGLAITEFALSAPFLMVLGAYGLEASNLAITHLRMSQISANLADTASRVGLDVPDSLKQIRESDINDIFQAVRLQSASFNLTTKGRVILSSLELDSTNKQYIHWSRCLGLKKYTSKYGVAGDGLNHTAGLGDSTKEIKAISGFSVMFVELVYDYQPLISNKFFGVRQVRTKAAFLVRDNREQDNPAPPLPAKNPSNPTLSTIMDCSVDRA